MYNSPLTLSYNNNRQCLHCYSGLISNKMNHHGRRQPGPVELPQFSAAVAATAGAERGQKQVVYSKLKGKLLNLPTVIFTPSVSLIHLLTYNHLKDHADSSAAL